jgi:hypothetical protein
MAVYFSTSFEWISTNLELIQWLAWIGVMIWLLAIIYFISGVPGAYVLWYRPLYNAMRLCICFCCVYSCTLPHCTFLHFTLCLFKCVLQDWKCFEVWVVFLVLPCKIIITSYIRKNIFHSLLMLFTPSSSISYSVSGQLWLLHFHSKENPWRKCYMIWSLLFYESYTNLIVTWGLESTGSILKEFWVYCYHFVLGQKILLHGLFECFTSLGVFNGAISNCFVCSITGFVLLLTVTW